MGTELKTTLKAHKLLIPLNAKYAKNTEVAQLVLVSRWLCLVLES